MESMSVYELLTKLSESIAASKDLVPISRNAKCQNCRRRSVKHLRAVSYEILLHKSTLPTYPKSSWCSDGFDFIKDPAYDILLLSTAPHGVKLSQEMQNLQENIRDVIKSGLSEDPDVQSVLELLLNLKDEAPEANYNVNDRHWFNTGESRLPRKCVSSSAVTPYTIYGPETFRPNLLEKSLETRVQCGCFQYELPRKDLLQEEPSFKIPFTGGNAVSSTTFRCCKLKSSYSLYDLKCTEERTSLVSPLPLSKREQCDDLGWDYSDKACTDEGSDLRTWEELGDPYPSKNLPHLMEAQDPTLIYDLLRLEKTKDDTSLLTTLSFMVVPYSKYICDLKYMLIGVDSTSFMYDQADEKFVLQPDICVNGLSPRTVAASAAEWIECGSYCRRLSKMCATAAMHNVVCSGGRIYRALLASVGEYLYFYKAAIMGVSEKASILGLQVRIQKLRAHILCLSHLCKLDSDIPLPTGIRLLSYIYDEIMAATNPDLNGVLIIVLKACVTAYLSFLQTWLFEGSFVDPHQEFFIERNERFFDNRTRLYWKKAFVLHKEEAAGFLKGLDKAIFETGKALNLLKLCNPQDPLLGIVNESAPRLRLVLFPAELSAVQADHEAYYQRVVSVVGRPVTAIQLLQESEERQAQLQLRIKQVWDDRVVQFAAEREARAAEKISRQREQQEDMKQQARMRRELKEKEKQEEMELREREEKRELARAEEERAVAEKAKQNIMQHYSELFQHIEERKAYVSAQIAREERRYASNDEDDDIHLESASGTTGLSNTQTQATPNNNELPAFYGNPQEYILDNCPANQLTTDNNRLNMDDDVQNRNLAANDVTPRCDNIIGPTDNCERPTLIPSDFNQAKARKALSLDLADKHSMANVEMAENNDGVLSPTGSLAKTLEEYSELAGLGSRKSSADRIREKMLGYKVKSSQDADGYVVTAEGRMKQKKGAVPQVMLTAQQIKNKVLEDEFYICQSPPGPVKTSLQANRMRNLHGDVDVVTGQTKAVRTHGVYSKDTQLWTHSSQTNNLELKPSVDKHSMANIETTENNDAVLSPTGSPAKPLEYSELTRLGSRKSSTDRIREKMLGYKVKSSQDADGYVVTADGRMKQKKGCAAEVMLTAQQIKNKVLEEEFYICQSPPGPVKTSLQVNRMNNLHGDVDVVTMQTKAVRTHGVYSKDTQLWTPSTGSPSPAADSASVTSINSSTTANPFFKSVVKPSRSFNRLYSYTPLSQFDKDWQQRLLQKPPGNIARDLSPASGRVDAEEAVSAAGDASDLDSVNHMLKKTMIVSVRTQMRLVNDAVIRYFLVDQDLLSHLQSLRDYFFLLDGEFASTLTSSLFSNLQATARPSDLFHPSSLHAMLTEALASSCDSQGKNTGRLRLVVLGDMPPPPHFRHAAPDVLSSLSLCYDVDWPLNVLITPEVINKYRTVFEFLVRLRRISWVLEDVFTTLKQLGRERGYSESPQYARVQKCRHIMAHLVHALHNYVTSTVLQESWTDLQRDLQTAAILDDIYHVHIIYIKRVLLRCLLGVYGTAENFHKHLNNIFKLVLKFHGKLNHGKWAFNERSQHHEHTHYSDLVCLFKLFQAQACSLVKITKRIAVRGHFSHLFDILQRLNMNDYYEQQPTAVK